MSGYVSSDKDDFSLSQNIFRSFVFRNSCAGKALK